MFIVLWSIRGEFKPQEKNCKPQIKIITVTALVMALVEIIAFEKIANTIEPSL